MTQNRNLSILADNVSSAGVLGVSGGGTGLATTPSNGQLNIGNGTGFTRATLTAGSNISITNSAGGITIAATGTGKVLQVVQGVLSTRASTTSASFADTGLTVTITPTASTSKILVMATIGDAGAASSGGTMGLNIVRGSTNLAQGSASGSSTVSTFGAGSFGDQNTNWGAQSMTYLDSPATTSATTYKIQFASTYNSISCTINGSNNNAGSYNLSTYSTITVMEIAA